MHFTFVTLVTVLEFVPCLLLMLLLSLLLLWWLWWLLLWTASSS
jgi:hypothetical protein